MKKLSTLLLGIGIMGATSAVAQDAVTYTDQEKLHDIAEAVKAERIEQDIRKLVSFGTRHTLSETESECVANVNLNLNVTLNFLWEKTP